jgi:hypothetical protein
MRLLTFVSEDGPRAGTFVSDGTIMASARSCRSADRHVAVIAVFTRFMTIQRERASPTENRHVVTRRLS